MKYKESENVLNHVVKCDKGKLEDILKQELDISGRFLRRLYKAKSIILNGARAKGKENVVKGDIVTIIIEDESHNYKPEKIQLDIIYEDYDFIILNKQPGIVVHPTKSHSSGTIANGIAYYYKEKGIKKKIRFVNRLDMDTSGILVVAKNSFGHQQLSKQFEEDEVIKKYLVLVEGVVKKDEGKIDKPIGKDEADPIKNSITYEGKPSLTQYRVVERYRNATLIEARIITGRTHQIRVHMKYIGHPVIGDTLYNKPSPLIQRQALHSHFLRFRAPRSGEIIEAKAELPEDIKRVILAIDNS